MAAYRFRSLILVLAVASAVTVGACYQDPNEQLDQAQQTIDLQATLEELANKTSELQFAFDSLRNEMARQDSTIRKLANLAGVAYP